MTYTSKVRIYLNINRFIFLVLVVFCVLASNICRAGSCKGTKGDQKRRANLRTFTDQDKAKEFKLRSGERFKVQLAENPTTGFLWTVLESSSPNIELLRKEFFPPKNPNAIGAGGIRVFVFKTTKPGHAVLYLGLKRPWEKEDKYADTYSLKLWIE